MTEQEKSDEALIAEYQQGCESALETLIRRHGGLLLGYLTRMTRNPQHAEDLFQETFIRVHIKAGSYEARGSFKSWLFSIATRTALDFLRKMKREPSSLASGDADAQTPAILQSVPDPVATPAENATLADRAGLVRKALEALPPRQRATLVLAYYEDLSYPEVARTLGCSVGTVKTQMSRALRTLARLLREIAPAMPGGMT